jgi:hypothetical protein
MKIKDLNTHKIVLCAGVSVVPVIISSFLTSYVECTKPTVSSEINDQIASSLDQVEQFKKQSIEKLAAQINNLATRYLDKTSDETNAIMQKQISIYNQNTNLSNFIADLNSPTNDELTNAYHAILKENQKLQLDVTD